MIITAVTNNNIANKYSIIFLTLTFLIIFLIEAPKAAQIHIDGKQTKGAVIATKEVATMKFSSLGKKAEAEVTATTQALGFIN